MQDCGRLHDALNALKCISEVICVYFLRTADSKAAEITITVFVADCKGEAAVPTTGHNCKHKTFKADERW